MLSTTLDRLVEVGIDKSGYDALRSRLADDRKGSDPLPYAQILRSGGLMLALWCTRAEPRYARQWMQYGVKCLRRVQHLSKEPRIGVILDLMDDYARKQVGVSSARNVLNTLWTNGDQVEDVVLHAVVALVRTDFQAATHFAARAVQYSTARGTASEDMETYDLEREQQAWDFLFLVG